MNLIDIATLALLGNGLFFFFVGTIGLLRLPDVFTRMQATTKCDTLGAVSVLAGLTIYSSDFFTASKMVLIIIFAVIANSTAAHAISKAAYISGEQLYEGTVIDEYGRDRS
ncbi:MAG: monovalent cation/H(+) antiporter subunit G [Candidatus Hydrothermarchaeales archaeon]